MYSIISVVGARPNFVKMSPIDKELMRRGFSHKIVHTGQHYDENMSKNFFNDLRIPYPDINFEIGSGTHIYQIINIMEKFEFFCQENKPDIVLVYGDVTSTLACSIVCNKLRIPLAHIESGLRSFDREMPEEINRILTDQISDLLFTTSEYANKNLLNEGIKRDKIFFVGNSMIDSLVENLDFIDKSNILQKLGVDDYCYDVLTLHRPSNVDDKSKLEMLMKILSDSNFDKKIVFPIHPRTKKNIHKFGLSSYLDDSKFILIEPLGYLDFIKLIKNARGVWTDSGGIQEETSFLGVPCFTIRENTERPVTIEIGTNKLISIDKNQIFYHQQKNKDVSIPRVINKIPLWDGNAAERIGDIIIDFLENINHK